MIFPKKVLIISLIVIVVAACVYFFIIRDRSEAAGDESSDSAAEGRTVQEASLPVKVDMARRGDLIITLKSPGEAMTNRNITMKAEVSGMIKSLNVEESRHVKEGELLVELDDEEYRLTLERREAERLRVLSEYLVEKRFSDQGELSPTVDAEKVQKARDEYERARKLFRAGQISRDEYEKAGRELEMGLIESGEMKEEILAATKNLTQSEIGVKEAQLELEKTKIRAPFSGIVFDIQVSPQEHITTGTELFTLVNIDRIHVQARVLESEIGKMQVGREVDLKFSAYPGKVFKGKVKAISPVINPEDRTCKVTIEVANPEEEIKPGMHADVEIAAEIYKDRLLIPQSAVLVRTGGRKLAFVVEENIAKWRYIDVGLENEDFVEILDGVKEGEVVCVDGHFTLAHDARVRIEK
ncbi:MAG: efflux RND transporter periplasmic adaptor subunit [Candidatus Aminicenantes bacterium]|nr:MAG: efflux RND transporter periplasmic adaptor subunit [Candidatus Aminicenantes bacterium]